MPASEFHSKQTFSPGAERANGPGNITPPDAPFLVQHYREAIRGHGHDFTPAARLVLTPALRTQGLWAELPPEELRDLILVLTFLTPNGWITPSLQELADAMQVSEARAKERMERLTRRLWRGGPVVHLLAREAGPDAYAPGPLLLAAEQEVPHPESAAGIPSRPTAGREAVLAHSRARYARSRQEVEQEIAQRMGWSPPEFAGDDPPTAQRKRLAYEQLTGFGVAKEEALDVLARFDLDRVERQVGWMGRRSAKNPARFLRAAIENDYDAPLSIAQPMTQRTDDRQETAKNETGDEARG